MSNYPGALSGGFVSHRFVSLKADQPDLSVINASNWNQSHIIGSGAIQSGALGSLAVTSGVLGSGAINPNNVAPALLQGPYTVLVYVSGGAYYVKDGTGQFIVSGNQITAYGASLSAGTSGATTTTAGIQEAVNSLGTSGGLVHIAAGLYTNITTTIALTKTASIVIEGEGRGLFNETGYSYQNGTILEVTSIMTSGPIAALSGGVVFNLAAPAYSYTKIKDIRINMKAGTTAQRNVAGIYSKTENCDLENLLVIYPGPFGIYIDGANGAHINNMFDVWVRNVSYSGNTYGIYANSLADSKWYKAVTEGSNNATNNVATSYGIYLQTCTFMDLISCRTDTSSTGAVIAGAASNIGLTACTAYKNLDAGFAIQATDITLVGCKASSNNQRSGTSQGGAGYYIQSGQYIQILGCSVFDDPNLTATTQFGIAEQPLTTQLFNRYIGNQIRSATNASIFIVGNSGIGATYTVGNDPFNEPAGGVSLGTLTGISGLGQLSGGGVYNNVAGKAATIYQTVQFAPTTNSGSSVSVYLGTNTSPSLLYTDVVLGTAMSGTTRTFVHRIPAGYSFKFSIDTNLSTLVSGPQIFLDE